jgi:hypothetical protein
MTPNKKLIFDGRRDEARNTNVSQMEVACIKELFLFAARLNVPPGLFVTSSGVMHDRTSPGA